MKAVIDCGNAAAWLSAPQIFKELGIETTELFCNVDGTFPNHHPDPTEDQNLIDLVKELLQSVDIIPNSIVLAQAANESGWGSSRFASEYNALFGQYTYDEKNGVVPLRRDKGERYLIKYFSSIDKSVESYFRNINTHYAYKKFRQIRSEMNTNNLGLNVKLLTQHLDVYAKDELYVETINSIIETNNFTQFDLINQFFVNS